MSQDNIAGHLSLKCTQVGADGKSCVVLPLLHQQSFHQFYQHLCLSRAMKQTKHQDTQTLNMAASCGWILVRPTKFKRDLFKKIRDTKGTFHAKIGSIKYRNGRDLTEAEDIKKRWQAYTEELYKKDLHDPDNHNGQFSFQSQRKAMPKNSNYCTIALISHASKVMLQARLQQ